MPLKTLSKVSDVALCVVRKWWRPVVCMGMGWALVVNGVIIPLHNWVVPDLVGLAAVIAALTPFAWLRSKEKEKGLE